MMNRTLAVGVLLAAHLMGCGEGSTREAKVPQQTTPAAGETMTPASDPGDVEAAEPTPATATQPAEKVDTVDCSRIDDPAYRKQLEASGIDPDSIDCFENDTGG